MIEDTGILKGFIVADAHFGWKNHQADQKEHPECTQEAMVQIMKRFPDLDLFVDAGDAHHGNVEDHAREQWTEIIANGTDTVPFFFSVGNHELAWDPKYDIELRSNILGSIPCRPYYSFDLKGVHFICLPELITAATISEESIEWLKLDLTLNRDKTTIIFSHNSIKGTTLPQDDLGYRRLANSDEMFDLLLEYPNGIAWMHGHQHTFEMVELARKVFVSVGRIGGFDPRYPYENKAKQGMGHLGGIYFEITPDRVTFKSYSATQDKFFDEIPGHQHLTKTLEVKTSLDLNAPSCFSYGSGNVLDKQRMPVFNHYVGSAKQELYITGSEGSIINENADMVDWYQRTLPDCQSKHLCGYYIEPLFPNVQMADETWQWVSPGGAKIRPYGHMGETRRIDIPGRREGERCYYRCAPGTKYTVSTTIDTQNSGQKMFIQCKVFNNQLRELASFKSPEWTCSKGRDVYTYVFEVPDTLNIESIYSNPESDTLLQMMAEMWFPDMKQEVFVRNVEWRFTGATENTSNPTMIVDGHAYTHKGHLNAGQYASYELPATAKARTVLECQVDGSRRLTWMIRQVGVQWQVRNAIATDKGNYFVVGPVRNPYSPDKEIIIVPMFKKPETYIHRLRHIEKANVYPGKKTLKVEVTEIEQGTTGEVEFITPVKPGRVEGGTWEFSDGKTIVTTKSPGTILVEL